MTINQLIQKYNETTDVKVRRNLYKRIKQQQRNAKRLEKAWRNSLCGF